MFGLIYLKTKRHWRAWIKIAKLYLFSPLLIKSLKTKTRESNLIISFTTYKPRVKAVDHTLRSIVAGSILPENIYLYIDEETFKEIKKRSSFINKLVEAKFLHLRIVEDVRSYTKLVYALTEHREKTIVICDDDVLYPKYWLRALVTTNKKWSDSKIITCHRGHVPAFKEGKFAPYNTWSKAINDAKTPTSQLFPTGTGGVLYPPQSLPTVAHNVELFKKYSPTGDDIWFWFSALSNNCKFVLTDRAFNSKHFMDIPDSQTSNLFTINVHQKANDVQLENCLGYFSNEVTHHFKLWK